MTSYKSLRRKLMRRLHALETSSFGPGAKEDIAYLRTQVPSERELKTARQRRMAKKSLERALSSDLYSIRGRQRINKRRMETLQRHGINMTSRAELEQFGEFMQDVQDYAELLQLDSDVVAYIYNYYKEHKPGMTNEEIKEKLKEYSENRKIPH